MIIKPVRRGGFTAMGKYILDLGVNDSSDVLGIYNLPLAKNVWDAMGQMRLMMGEKLQGPHKVNDPFEHIVFRPRQGEILTHEQYTKMKTETIKHLGYENCPRVEWEDVLHGEPHQHIVILRMDANGNLIQPYKRIKTCIEVARAFEERYALKPALKGSPKASFYDTKKQIAKLWQQTEGKCGVETKSFFMQNGFILAKGDRGQFILISKKGVPYNPARILELKQQGLNEAGVRARFEDVEINDLPSVKEIQTTFGAKPRAMTHRKKNHQSSKDRINLHIHNTPDPIPLITSPSLSPPASFCVQPTRHEPRRNLIKTPDSKRWPAEAVLDWELWGKKNPMRFFEIWPELAPGHPLRTRNTFIT